MMMRLQSSDKASVDICTNNGKNCKNVASYGCKPRGQGGKQCKKWYSETTQDVPVNNVNTAEIKVSMKGRNNKADIHVDYIALECSK